ncbi:MAG: hypothetical protein AAF928_10600 [Myxococcota bacterium]
MKARFQTVGYLLVDAFARTEVMDARLPSQMWSPSTCLSNAYPDADFTWVTTSSEQDDALRTRLGLSEVQLSEYKADATRLLDEGHLGWPSLFLSLPHARSFAARWLTEVVDLRLLGIALPTDLASSATASCAPEPGMGPSGVYLGLKRQAVDEEEGTTLGFDVLGLEAESGSFHAPICNDLVGDFIDRLELSLNEHALLSTLTDATRAADFCRLDETGAEPALWLPWRIRRHELR